MTESIHQFTSNNPEFLVDEVGETIEEESIGRIRRIGRAAVDLYERAKYRFEYSTVAFNNDPVHYTKRAIEGAVLFTQITPLNEALRFSAGGAAIAAGADPVVTAGVYGASTALIEGSAALATASWLDTENSDKAIRWFNDKLEKRGISADTKFSALTKTCIAMIGGTAIVQAVKHREDPERTKNENRRYGLKSAAGLAGMTAVQGYLVAKGIDAPDPLTIGGALLAVGGTVGIYKWGRRKIAREQDTQITS
ncbi:hypothetical protein DYH10_03660 [Candidatus Saccharibacteria bacterium CPR2]|nr:hypothetical protein [Candidatus Saccharibacteria bacterium CPR2]